MSTVPAETPEAAQAPAHTEAPAPAWPVPACWRFLYPRRPFPTLAETAEMQARGVGVLGVLPDPRDDPELFRFSCRLGISTMQVLLVDAGGKEVFRASLRELQGNTAFCAALDGHGAE